MEDQDRVVVDSVTWSLGNTGVIQEQNREDNVFYSQNIQISIYLDYRSISAELDYLNNHNRTVGKVSR